MPKVVMNPGENAQLPFKLAAFENPGQKNETAQSGSETGFSCASMSVGLILAGPDFLVKWFNPAAAKWALRHFEAVLEVGSSLPGLFSGDHFGIQVRQALDQAFSGEQSYCTCSFESGDHLDYFELRFRQVERGNHAGSVLVEIIGLDPQRLNTQALLQSNELFLNLVKNSTDVITVVDADGTIRFVSPAVQQVLGFTEEGLLGKKAQDLLHPEDRKRLEQNVFLAGLKSGAQIALSFRVQHADGRWVHLESVGTNLLNVESIGGYVINTRDISERKKAEELLHAEKEQLSVTLRSIGDGVITTDLSGRVVMMNKKAEELTGWSQGDASGKPLPQIYRVFDSEDDDANQVDILERVRTRDDMEMPEQNEYLVSKDDERRIIFQSGARIRAAGDATVGYVIVFRDVTERERMTQEIHKATRLESVGMLAGGIAHDFNNILLAIIGNISLARLEAKDDAMQTRLQGAENASMRARDLTRQLLTFAKGGAPILNTQDLSDVIRESVEFVLHGSRVDLELHIEEGLKPVDADAGQISQVLNNLSINAMQAMTGSGNIAVHACNATLAEGEFGELPAGDYLRIDVCDNGSGIPKAIQAKLFDPFFTTKPTGSGLGLATSFSIIQKHGGHICVESELGEGTVFTIHLPASKNTPVEKEKHDDRDLTGSGRLLLMDDDSDIRLTTPLLLESYGYEIDTASDGEEAINMYENASESGRPYAAVILDLTVPGGMGGKDAFTELLKFDSDVKAIVSSGYSNDAAMAEFRQHGFSGVVSKPYRIEELARVLKRIIESHSAAV